MVLALIIALPFLGTLLSLATDRFGRRACALGTAIAPAVALALLATQLPAVLDGAVLLQRLDWLPALGLNLSLRLDGLGLMFALMILVIGLLVILYATYYLSKDEKVGRFFAYLLLFRSRIEAVPSTSRRPSA